MDDTQPKLDAPKPQNVILPVLPVVITTLMSADFEDPKAFDELLGLVRCEPCIAIRLLQVDSAQGFLQNGGTLSAALTHIGTRALQHMVTKESVAEVFTPMAGGEKGLWLHAIQVAMLSEALAKEFADLSVNPDQAFLAGLLHDVGRFAYYKRVADGPNEIDGRSWASPEELLAAETATFGIDHVQVAEKICDRLAVPDYVKVVMMHHHKALKGRGDLADGDRKIIELVQLADLISVAAMRQKVFNEKALGNLCRSFVNEQSVFLKALKPKTYVMQTNGIRCIKQSAREFLRLKLGNPPVAAA